MRNLKIILFVTVLILSACSVDLLPKETPNLDGTAWVLVKINGESPIDTATVTLSFDGQTVNGNGGCNQYGGDVSYSLEGNLEFSPLFSTRMYCRENGISDQESVYLSALDEVISFSISDGNLFFVNEAGETILEYMSQE